MRDMCTEIGNFFDVFNYDDTVAELVVKFLFDEPNDKGTLFKVSASELNSFINLKNKFIDENILMFTSFMSKELGEKFLKINVSKARENNGTITGMVAKITLYVSIDLKVYIGYIN